MQILHPNKNMISRQSRIRRFIFYCCSLASLVYLTSLGHVFYADYLPTYLQHGTPAFNELIDIKGEFIDYYSYSIVQHASSNFVSRFTDLYAYLDQQTDLKLYFQLIPTDALHVTLTKLKNGTILPDANLEVLKNEQKVLDGGETFTQVTGSELILVIDREIRLKVAFSQSFVDDRLTPFQARWTQGFPSLIVEHLTSFYITLAYQFQTIPDQETRDRVSKILSDWQEWPIEFELDGVEICLFNNSIVYAPLLAEQLPEIES